jgi:hypothetical protein
MARTLPPTFFPVSVMNGNVFVEIEVPESTNPAAEEESQRTTPDPWQDAKFESQTYRNSSN